MVGPTRQGFDDLIDGTLASCDTFGEVFEADPNNPAYTTIDPDCDPFPPHSVTGSHRLVILPVIETLCAARCDVPIVQFALFFVTGVQCNAGECRISGLYAEDISGIPSFQLGAYNQNSAFNSARLIE